MAILVPANDVVALAERIHQLRHDFKQIPDQPVIRHLEVRLLMATMTLDSFIPARCWMAPEMPTAR